MSIFLTILAAVILLICPIIILISITGYIKMGSLEVDLTKYEEKVRILIATVSLILWLAAFIPLANLAIKSAPSKAGSQPTTPTLVAAESSTPTQRPPTSTPTETSVPDTPTPTATATLTPTITLTPTETATPGPSPTPLPVEKVLVLDGTFLMGSNYSETRTFYPAHDVYTDRVYIDKYEVTNAQYAQCVEAGGCSLPDQVSSNTREHYFDNLTEYGNYPVIYVTWYDAKTFCEWRGGRLPTEAEWEKAAKWHPGSGITDRFPWGSSFPEVAQTNYQSEDTTEVGSFPLGASHIGVHDMAGNVFEWVSDVFGSTYYSYSPEINPTGPKTDEGDRVLRGGSWSNQYDSDLYTFWRFHQVPDIASDNVGFRCAEDYGP